MGKTSNINSQADFIRRDYGYHYFLISAVTLTCAIAVAFIGLSSRPVTYLLIFLLFIATLVPLIFAIRRKSFDCFEPIYILSFLYFVYFVVRAVFVLNTDPDFRINFLHLIDISLLYVLIGFLSLLVGYYSRIPFLVCKRLPALRFNTSAGRMRLFIYVSWAVSTLIFIYNIKTGVYAKWLAVRRAPSTATQSFVDYLAMLLGLFAYTLALIQCFSRHRTKLLSIFLWCVILPTQGLYIFLTGEKKMLIYLIVIFMMVYHYIRRKITLRSLVFLFLLVVFVLFPLFNAYRKVNFGGLKFQTLGRDLSHIKKGTVSSLQSSSTSEYLKKSINAFMWRFPGIDGVSAVIMSMPQRINFQYGKTFLKFFIVPIPNFILENKNDYIRQGEIFNPRFFDRWEHSDSILVPVGEFYINFGLPGIVLGMLLLGVLFKTFYVYFRRCSLPVSVFIYVFVWIAITNVESDLGIVYGILIRQLLIILIVLRFMNKGRLFVAK